jgi:hypothetical protein
MRCGVDMGGGGAMKNRREFLWDGQWRRSSPRRWHSLLLFSLKWNWDGMRGSKMRNGSGPTRRDLDGRLRRYDDVIKMKNKILQSWRCEWMYVYLLYGRSCERRWLQIASRRDRIGWDNVRFTGGTAEVCLAFFSSFLLFLLRSSCLTTWKGRRWEFLRHRFESRKTKRVWVDQILSTSSPPCLPWWKAIFNRMRYRTNLQVIS